MASIREILIIKTRFQGNLFTNSMLRQTRCWHTSALYIWLEVRHGERQGKMPATSFDVEMERSVGLQQKFISSGKRQQNSK